MFRRNRTTPEVDRVLLRYLQLRVAELERAAEADLEGERRSAIRGAVGQMVAWLLLFVGYAIALGLASASVLNEALANPGLLVDRLRTVLRIAGETSVAVPDPIRGVLLSATSALILLIFRSASFNLRSDIGGALFMGLLVVSLAGLSSAAASGILGVLVALPGFVAAIAIGYELVETLKRLSTQWTEAEPRPKTRLLDWLAAVAKAIHPRRSLVVSVLFAGLPWLFVAMIGGSILTEGGPLWWPSRLSMYGLAVWSVWALLVTPPVVRVALWSIVPWSALVALQLAIGVVAVIFAFGVVLLLHLNIVLAVLRSSPSDERESGSRPREPAPQPT